MFKILTFDSAHKCAGQAADEVTKKVNLVLARSPRLKPISQSINIVRQEYLASAPDYLATITLLVEDN